ncbi:MAG: 23S rRNA (adenine(2503)-C(2))-methyltransferase RlmN [Polyangiaceae bacterium]
MSATLLQVRRRSTVVRETRPSTWALLPEDLTTLHAPGSAAHLFGALQRPWTWTHGEPFIGKATRAFLAEHSENALPKIVSRHTSEDGATKVALELSDGERIEAVHMPRDVRNPRVTLCISSQVGCAMGCTFCATATMGLRRQLSAGEIVGQVLTLLHELGPRSPGLRHDRVHGHGRAPSIISTTCRARFVCCVTPAGLGMSPNRITVSTSGLVSGIDKLAKTSPRPLLALSLNATTDEIRRRTMPINDTWGLTKLREALGRWPLRNGEKITLEYVLLSGVNDSDEDADRLASWIGDLRHNLNVIPYNEFDGTSYKEAPEEQLQRFVKRLQDQGRLVTVRRSRGRDVQAACGQLVKHTSDAAVTVETE